jgi:hypothetical protein
MTKKTRRRRNLIHVVIALAVALSGLILLFCFRSDLGWLIVVIVDVYLAVLLFTAARTGLTHQEPLLGMPDRDWSLLILPCLFLALVSAFGSIYIGTAHTVQSSQGELTGSWDSLYFSIVTITTLGYGDFVPGCLYGRLAVVGELLSGMLLLLLAIPILVSRLAGFGEIEGSGSLEPFDFHGLKISLSPNAKSRVEDDNALTCEVGQIRAKITKSNSGAFDISLNDKPVKSDGQFGGHVIVTNDGLFARLRSESAA